MSNFEVMLFLKSGKILSQPDGCPDKVYELMKLCWKQDPDERPAFKHLNVFLNRLYVQQRQREMYGEFQNRTMRLLMGMMEQMSTKQN